MLADRSRHSGTREAFSQLEAYERLGIAAIAVDAGLHIVFFNEKARKMTEYSREKALRRSIFDIVVSGNLKKCLKLAMKGDTVEPGFITRSTLVTRGGKVRAVEWQGITLYDEGKPIGVLLTGIDVTGTGLVREAARIAARSRDIEEMTTAFMGLLGDPLNLKIARMSICVDGREPLTVTQVFPHGGVRKKPRNALDDTSDDRELDVRYFKLRPGNRSIGALEVTAYAGARLIEDDVDCVQALCDIISTGIARLLPPVYRRPDLSGLRETGSATALVDPCDFRVIDASSQFYVLAGKADLNGVRLEDVLPSAGITEAVRMAVSVRAPQWGVSRGAGNVYCCMPICDEKKDTEAILVSVLNPPPGISWGKDRGSSPQGPSAENILSMLPHGLAVCDCDGVVVTANDMVAGLLGTEKAKIEGRVFASILKELSPEHWNGKAFTLKQLAFHRTVQSGFQVVEAFMTISVAGRKRAMSVIFSPLRDHGGTQTGCIVTIRDVTILYALLRMSRIVAEAVEPDDLIDETLDLIANASRLKIVWLYLYDGNELTLRMQKGDVTGVPLPVCREVPESDSPTLQCRAFYRARPVLIKDYRRCASVRTFDPLARSRSIRSMAAIPLLSAGQTLGVLVAATGPNQPLREPQLAELTAMCEQLSTGIARSMRGKNPAGGGACP